MRFVMAIMAVLIASGTLDSMLNRASAADPYRWYAQYGGRSGATNCYFVTLGQCRAAISGLGGFCRPNPFYTGSPATHRRSQRYR
jgi:hypothetical protein